MSSVNEKSVSPATPHSQPHGINKSFLTPCRRLGLKRKSPNLTPRSPADCNRNVSVLNDDIVRKECLSNTTYESPGNLTDGTAKIDSNSVETPKRGERQFTTSFVAKERSLKNKQRRTHNVLAGTENMPHQGGVELITSSKTTTEIQHAENAVEVQHAGNTTEVQHAELETQICYDETTLENLRRRVAEKEDKVQSLKIAHLYKKKHDISKLKETISKWKDGCQSALQDLLVITQQRGHGQITMVQLLAHLGIPPDLVGYDPEQEEFL